MSRKETMHSSNFVPDPVGLSNADLLLAACTLIKEGRGDYGTNKLIGGPHCSFLESSLDHKCCFSNPMCISYDYLKDEVLKYGYENTSICIEVYVSVKLGEIKEASKSESSLLECWHFSIVEEKNDPSSFTFTIIELVNAVRSQLHFSQITAWMANQCKCQVKITTKNFHYRIALPNKVAPWKSSDISIEHTFPYVDLGNGCSLRAHYRSLRIAHFPINRCLTCTKSIVMESEKKDRKPRRGPRPKRVDRLKPKNVIEISKVKSCSSYELIDENVRTEKCIATTSGSSKTRPGDCDNNCDTNECDSRFKLIYDKFKNIPDKNVRKKISFDKYEKETNKKNSSQGVIPTTFEQENFRKNLGNAASMVFHSRTGLPLTSSPAPVRRQSSRFDFDSSLNSVSAIKSALFSNTFQTDDESENDDANQTSPSSPLDTYLYHRATAPRYMGKYHCSSLLGSFEESVLNGRLKPASTVHGFTAELGASGSFVPKHLHVPVTVFFYTFGDNTKITSPYLGHINLGRKGYNIPKSGTVQVTLFNPTGTVVKMFVVMYDCSDMPTNSQTFIRQRTMYVPTDCDDSNIERNPKWLRYLIHLRFITSKSGKLYLHSDIRIIIFHKSDQDTANAHAIDTSYELRSFTHTPADPRYSLRTAYK